MANMVGVLIIFKDLERVLVTNSLFTSWHQKMAVLPFLCFFLSSYA